MLFRKEQELFLSSKPCSWKHLNLSDVQPEAGIGHRSLQPERAHNAGANGDLLGKRQEASGRREALPFPHPRDGYMMSCGVGIFGKKCTNPEFCLSVSHTVD